MSKVTHLVTGYAGVEHIKSSDQGSFNAAFFGDGQFVMEIGEQFKGSIIDNNTFRVADGSMLMNGRHIMIEPGLYEDLSIGTGTSGTNRIDLVVMTYVKDTSTGIEDAYLEIIEGTATAGTATEPEYIVGNILDGAVKSQMPLYALNINGISVTNATKKFTTCPTYKALAERYAAKFEEACLTYIGLLNVLDTMSEINANTSENQLAGALAVKELAKAKQDASSAINTGNIANQSVSYASSAGSAGSVPWTGITSKPSSYPPSSHSHAWSAITGKPSSYTPSDHTHDDRYYTESEVNSLLNGKSNTDHNHDSRYYTESEINTKTTAIYNEISDVKSYAYFKSTYVAYIEKPANKVYGQSYYNYFVPLPHANMYQQTDIISVQVVGLGDITSSCSIQALTAAGVVIKDTSENGAGYILNVTLGVSDGSLS